MRKVSIFIGAIGALALASGAIAGTVNGVIDNGESELFGHLAGRGSEITVNFQAITANGVGSPEIAEMQMSVNIMDNGDIKFTFSNAGPLDSSITQIYFDETTQFLGAISAAPTGVGTMFTADSTPLGNLPSGNTASPAFMATREITADSPPSMNGIEPNEMMMVSYDLLGTFDSFLSELASGAFRIGIHVQSFSNGQSESLVSCVDCDTTIIPLPSAAGMGLLGIGGLVMTRRRRA